MQKETSRRRQTESFGISPSPVAASRVALLLELKLCAEVAKGVTVALELGKKRLNGGRPVPTPADAVIVPFAENWDGEGCVEAVLLVEIGQLCDGDKAPVVETKPPRPSMIRDPMFAVMLDEMEDTEEELAQLGIGTCTSEEVDSSTPRPCIINLPTSFSLVTDDKTV